MADDSYAATSEMRFAVVLYGGVSLAIYMNGIAQELLALVRATAPKVDGDGALHVSELRGAEAVYRELGRRLDRGKYRHDAPDAVCTRFVVDLITGTSAGGINGVFLAKALANDQDISALSTLWVDEGDIAKLLNDGAAVSGLGGLTRDTPPKALLSGRRMLFKLVQAMRTVSQEPAAQESPYADAIDLWVTATDLRGRVEGVAITAQNPRDAVYESNYRMTFHFLYEKDSGLPNMFDSEYDALLSFAARCTSSFPGAFEAAQLTDVATVIPHVVKASDGSPLAPFAWDADAPQVQTLFKEYGSSAESYETRSFADGGYLDNNPVDLVLNTLPKRRATVPVARRVLIVDPDPGTEPSPSDPVVKERVDLVSTLIKVASLPRQEAIGPDVARIKALGEPAAIRQKLYARVDECLDTDGSRLQTGTLGAAAYRELRRINWMRDVASALARVGYDAKSFDDDTPQYRLLVQLLESWRREHPQRFAVRSAGADLAFELRRVNFLQGRLNAQMCAPDVDRDSKEFRRGEYLRHLLDHQYRALAQAGRKVRYRVDNPAGSELGELRAALAAIEHPTVQVGPLLLFEQIFAVVRAHNAIDAVVARFNDFLRPEIEHVRRRVRRALQQQPYLVPHLDAWRSFLLYDEVTYALQEQLPGENEDIEVHRISPRDATALLDERREGIPKLAGANVHHFGGFFSADWRRNDILWGRLDAAERIIRVVCPSTLETSEVDQLITRAHEGIVRDVLRDKEYRRLLSRLLANGERLPAECPTDANAVAKEVDAVLDGFRRRYSVPPPPDRRTVLKLASRAARVTDEVGTDLSRSQAKVIASPLAWIGRTLRLVAGLVDLVLAEAPWDIARHLVDLTIVAAVLMIVLGGVVGGDTVVGFGWTVLAVTVALKLLVETADAWAQRRRWWLVPGVLLALFAVLGYVWVASTSGTAGSVGLVAFGVALGFLLTSRQGGFRLLPVLLAVIVIVGLGVAGLRHDRDVLVGHACDGKKSVWEPFALALPTVDCPPAKSTP